jgi:two-component system CheB/CheR fusion protein
VEQHSAVVLKDIEWPSPQHETRFFDLHVTPLTEAGGRLIGVGLAIVDASRLQQLQSQLTRSKHDLEATYEALQSTNEELETINEELQSTIEELETTNEELQSTNEDLEAMNEELQSSNQELRATGEEIRDRSEALNRANAFLEAILAGVRSGVIVVDRELRVVTWNRWSEVLWGLGRDEVKGQNLLSLDIDFSGENLRTAIRRCVAGDADHVEAHVQAVNRRGQAVACRVTVTPLRDSGEVHGAILMADEEPAEFRSATT